MKHEIRKDLIRVASDLGRTPTFTEYFMQGLGKHPERQVRKHFGSFSLLVTACGLDPAKPERQKKEPKFKYKPQKLEGFSVHELDLALLFKRAGNPDVLKMICQPDTHVPFHDEAVLSCALKFASYFKPHVWMNMGDYMDMAGISHWPSDSMKPRRLIPEMKVGREVLERIASATPTVSTRIYLEGNHEDWLRQAKVAKLPELFDGIEELGGEDPTSLKSLLALDQYGYDLYPLNHFVKIGRAYFSHGLYVGNNHPAKHLKLGKNFYYGHTHDDTASNHATLDGPIEAASLGCWSRKDAPFLKGRPTNWTHNMNIFEFFRDGTYTRACLKMIQGRMAYDGKTFKGD